MLKIIAMYIAVLTKLINPVYQSHLSFDAWGIQLVSDELTIVVL